MADLAVRRLTSADRSLHLRPRDALWPEGADEHAAELERLMPRADFAAFLAKHAGEPVGFAEASIRSHANGIDDGPVGFLEGIWVAPDDRRAGVATALLRAVAQWARDQGCHALGSDAELNNDISHAWHEAAGFEEVDRVVCFAKRLD